jgi:hypothetical protein
MQTASPWQPAFSLPFSQDAGILVIRAAGTTGALPTATYLGPALRAELGGIWAPDLWVAVHQVWAATKRACKSQVVPRLQHLAIL